MELLKEIWISIRKNKTRSLLTGFAVAWGIFMLIFLLGAGNGLRRGIEKELSGIQNNTISVFWGYTSMPYAGYPINRRIYFTEEKLPELRRMFPEIEVMAPSMWLRESNLTYGEKYVSQDVEGTVPEMSFIYTMKFTEPESRFINEHDVKERRKVIVLHDHCKQILFGDEPAVGKMIRVGNIHYRVVGVFDYLINYGNPPCFIPISTARAVYNKEYTDTGYSELHITTNSKLPPAEISDMLRKGFAKVYKFDPDDRSALWIDNIAEDVDNVNSMMLAITIFIIIIGLASLVAEIIGVANIMLISVKERTREIGIRKSLGASPFSVLKMVLLESIMITTLAGLIGIAIGVGVLASASKIIEDYYAESMGLFQNPGVDMGIVFAATAFLILCGAVAGAIPTIWAVRISPIEAMRS